MSLLNKRNVEIEKEKFNWIGQRKLLLNLLEGDVKEHEKEWIEQKRLFNLKRMSLNSRLYWT